MTGKTKIEWTDDTWNPIVGCSIVSKGCTNCYAMGQAARVDACQLGKGHYAGLTKRVKGKAVWTGKVAQAPEKARLAPLRATKPRLYFVNSMGDPFDSAVPDAWVDEMFAVMALSPHHTFQVLTKRPDRMREYLGGPFKGDGVCARIAEHISKFDETPGLLRPNLYNPRVYTKSPIGPMKDGVPEFGYRYFMTPGRWPLPNVWLGTSIEDQVSADQRIPDLLATPAALRFISAEPLLGPVDLESSWHGESALYSECWGDCGWCENGHPKLENCRKLTNPDEGGITGLDWVIAGGESGPNARPCHPDWIRALRDQCAAADVPYFFKQWGEWALGSQPSKSGERRCVYNDGRSVPDTMDAVSDEDLKGRHKSFAATVMTKTGKKKSGHLLDGVEHRAFPQTTTGDSNE